MEIRELGGLIKCVGKEWENAANEKKKKSSIGEELVDSAVTKGAEKIPQCPGWYSTKTSILIGRFRIPREGLQAVFYDEFISHGDRLYLTWIDIDCFYENGDWLSLSARLPVGMEGRTEEFLKAVRRFDESIPIYHHLYWEFSYFILCPFQRYVSQQPSIDRRAIEELTKMCEENRFWKVECKSRTKWNGSYEMKLFVTGSGITWILYLLLLVLMATAVLTMNVWVITGLWCAGGLCYYTFFYKPAHQIAVKAAKSLNCSCNRIKYFFGSLPLLLILPPL